MRTLLSVLLIAILGCSKIEGLKTELVGKTEIKMVIARVEMPNGQIFRLEVPEGTPEKQIIMAAENYYYKNQAAELQKTLDQKKSTYALPTHITCTGISSSMTASDLTINSMDCIAMPPLK